MQRCAGLLSAFVLILSSAILFPQPTAVAQEASPVATEATREPLFTTTVAPADLPTGTNLRFVIWYASIEPDVEVVLEAELFAEGPGPLIEHVLAGDLSLRVEGPLQVVRAGSVGTPGPVEEVTPGAEVVLRAGDTALYAQNLARVYANRGAEPVRLIGGVLFAVPARVMPPVEYRVINFAPKNLAGGVGAGPITFEMERVTLAPAAVLPAPAGGAVRVATSGPAVVYLPEASDGSISNLVKESVVAYTLTLLPEKSEAGIAEATPNGTG